MAKYNVSKKEAKRLGIKRVKVGGSSSKSSKSSSSSSSDRGGLSKREYEAKQAGGTLDYKTNTISVPGTKRRSQPSYQLMDEDAQQRSGTYGDGSQYGEAFGKPAFSFQAQQSKSSNPKENISSSKSSSSSNRKTAAPAYNKGGISGANVKASNQTSLGKGLQWINEAAGYGYGKLAGSEDPMLGLTQQLFGGDRGWTEDLKSIFGLPANAMLRDDPTSGGDYRNPNTTSAINYNEIGGTGEDRAISQQIAAGNNPVTNYPTTNNRATSVFDTSNLSSSNDRNDRQAPTDTGGNISYTPEPTQPISYQDSFNPYVEPEPANGGSIQGGNATINRPVGRGAYGNGAGVSAYSDLPSVGSGNSLGLGNDDENLLNKILGINTANAQEMPNQMTSGGGGGGWGDSSGNQQSVDPNFQNLDPFGVNPYVRKQEQQTDTIDDNFNNQNYDYTNYDQGYDQGSGGGGDMINNAPADRGGLSKREYATKYGQEWDPTGGLGDFGYAGDKSYENQQNEIKKQLADMIRGIESEYATAQERQTGEMGRTNRQNLNQLNSQFSFGNSDPNDEQRIQYQQRLQEQQGRGLADLLAQLQASKSKDILGARNQGSTNLQNLMSQQRDARSQAQGRQRDYQMQLQQMANSNKPKAAARTKGVFAGYNQDGTKKYVNPYTGEEMFSGGQGTDPTATDGPQRSTNPVPGYGPNGNVIDTNQYSPTYGQEMEQE